VPPAYNVPPEALEGEMQAELDADEKQDEILANAGVYPLPFHTNVVVTILVIAGVVIAFLGFLFWLDIGGLQFPSSMALASDWGSGMAIFLVVLGILCILAGIIIAARYRRDPYEMQPIR